MLPPNRDTFPFFMEMKYETTNKTTEDNKLTAVLILTLLTAVKHILPKWKKHIPKSTDLM